MAWDSKPPLMTHGDLYVLGICFGDLFVLVGFGPIGRCGANDVLFQRCGQFNDLCDPATVAVRPVVEHGDATNDSGSALSNPRHVDIDVFDSSGNPSAGRVARASGDDLVVAIVKEPNLWMVVRVRCWHRDTKPKRLCCDQPCEAVKCVSSERRCIGTSLDEYVSDELCRLLGCHLGALLDSGAFGREECRCDRKIDRTPFISVQVHRETGCQSSDPPRREPAKGTTNPRCRSESGNENPLRHRLVREFEKPRLKGAFVVEHAYSTVRRCIMRSRISSALLIRGSSPPPSPLPSCGLRSTRARPLRVTRTHWPG